MNKNFIVCFRCKFLKLLFIVLTMSALSFRATAQDELVTGVNAQGGELILTKSDRYLAAGVGIGPLYGNMGVNVTAKLTKKFGVNVGIGSRSTFPASFPVFLTQEKDEAELGLPFTNKTLNGSAYSVGIDLFLMKNFYMGFNFVQWGKYVSVLNNEKKPVLGGTMSFGGYIPLGKLPLSIHVGSFMGTTFGVDSAISELFPNQYGGTDGFYGAFMLGFDLGIVYRFEY